MTSQTNMGKSSLLYLPMFNKT